MQFGDMCTLLLFIWLQTCTYSHMGNLGVGQIEKLKEACENAHGWIFIFFCVIHTPGNLFLY
jgi:hypothetical protein